ncbi:MAG: hypothetical protein J6Q82_06335 [Clostridia bacterium]|nr:hypothetical protein [Clostridia bacterium]
MKNYKKILLLLFCAILFVSIVPLLLFWNKLQITKYSIPAIGLLTFHLLYGLLAYVFQNKGNFLAFSTYFLRNADIILFRKDAEYTFTQEYKQSFHRMLALYYSVVPMYLPCILLTSTPAAMPIALIVFFIPQSVFLFQKIQEKRAFIKAKIQEKQRMEEELREQKRKEELGKWK